MAHIVIFPLSRANNPGLFFSQLRARWVWKKEKYRVQAGAYTLEMGKTMEVVDVLLSQDLELLCSIEKMRIEQIIALEEKREHFKKMREAPW